MEVIVTKSNFESYLKNEPLFLLDIWATWCGPCQMLKPIMGKIAKEYEGVVTIGVCDAETNEEICHDLGVRNVPTLIMFKYGQEVKRLSGGVNRELIIKDLIAPVLP